MLNDLQRNQIIKLIKQEVVPAMGCTEPMAVSLCVAKATETPGETPVISVVDKKGNKISKVLTSTTKNDLVYDTFKALAKDDTFFAELPDEYKKIDLQGKPFFSSLYKADAIDPKYKKYFSMEENTVTGLKAIKMGDK